MNYQPKWEIPAKVLLDRLAAMWRFVFYGSGQEYGIGPGGRLRLGLRLQRIFLRARGMSASSYAEHILLLNTVLSLPKSLKGNIAEFGCYKGVASSTLSIGAKLTGRKLVVFDSFEGLPEPSESIRSIGDGSPLRYRRGDYCGTLMEVTRNITKFGAIDRVELVKGFFSETLLQRSKSERFVVIFEDADLVSSVREVLIHAWPKLEQGGYFFCHEARDFEVVRLFFDERFWNEALRSSAPGLVGSGAGVPLDRGLFCEGMAEKVIRDYGSCLGFVKKQ